MHYISHKNKALYIHIPKNGGHTICPLLKDNKWQILKMMPIQKGEIKKSILKNYYIFTIVRNPYDRFLSGWKSIMKKNKNEKDITPNYFHKNYNKIRDKIHINLTQTQHLSDTYNYLNKVYYFENFLESYNDINNKFNCNGIQNPSKKNKTIEIDFEEFMTEKIINHINIKFDEDFKNFNYKKL